MENHQHKGISRIDQPSKRTHGWYVRVIYNGLYYSKFFSDSKYGGAEKSLKEAIKFRNIAEKNLGKPRTDRVVVTANSKNRTGVVGVRRIVDISRRKSGEERRYESYEASWTVKPGIVEKRKFSIEKHGEQKAFELACRLRRKKEREIYGKVIQHAALS